MANMVPFNRRSRGVTPVGFDNFRNMLDDFFTDSWTPQRNLLKDSFKIDVQETEEGYLIEADMPGIDRKDIDLEFGQDNLRISVNREDIKEEDTKNYIHKERRYSSMTRNIYLGDIKQEAIDAKLENGVLIVNVPKVHKSSKIKKINIK